MSQVVSTPFLDFRFPIIRHGHPPIYQYLSDVLGMLAAGDSSETILEGYPWLEKGDIQACLLYARRLVGHEHIEQLPTEAPS